MTSQGTDSEYKELREKLAAIEHERWSDWQKWVHAQMTPVSHGHLLHHDLYQRWQRQIRTPYAELSDKEKASDLEQVDRYWPLILKLIATERKKAAIEELTNFNLPTYDHSKCPDPKTCMGYENAQSDFDNEKELRLATLSQEGENNS